VTRKRLGELLVQAGVIDETQLMEALEFQRSHGFRLGDALVELGLATEEQVLSALACRLGFERVELDTLPRTAEMAAAALLVPEQLARTRGVVPIAIDDRTLTVALRDPTDLEVMDELAFRSGRRLRVLVAGEREIWRATARVYWGRCELELDSRVASAR
jgi:hypothetical protein